jgi:gluconokinase
MSILGVDADGNAVTPVYTYADSRGADQVAVLRANLDERTTHQRVGTLFHTSYLPARIRWIARERAAEFKRAHYWMSFGEYLYFRLLGIRAISHSVASWTGLLNRATLDWDDELISILPIDRQQLSPVVDCEVPAGELRTDYAGRWSALKNSAWFPTIGDGAAANLGSGCVDASRAALTIGTSSALRIVIPSAFEQERGGAGIKIPPSLWAYRVDRQTELLGGALSEGGNVYAWMTDALRLDEAGDVECELAAMQPDAHGLTVLPFLAGERAPNWNADARASIIGLTLNTRPIEILRASIEAVAYRLGLVYDLLRDAAPAARTGLSVVASGGALIKSPTWIQMISDVLNVQVIASAEPEATSRGVALIALKATRAIRSFEDLPAQTGRVYQPDVSRHAVYARARKRQKKWYNLLLGDKHEKE